MVQLSDRELAKEFGVSPQVLARRFKASGIKTGKGINHTILQTHEALSKVSGVGAALDAAKLKNLEEDAIRKTFENKQLERELVSLDEAFDLVVGRFKTLAKMIKDIPSRLAVQCNPSDHELSFEVLDEYTGKLCDEIQKACTKK